MMKTKDTIRLRSSHPLLEGKQVWFDPNGVKMGHNHPVAGKNTVSMAINSMVRYHMGYREEAVVKELHEVRLRSDHDEYFTAELFDIHGNGIIIIVAHSPKNGVPHYKPGEVIG